MDNTFTDSERLYRAVYPPSHPGMYWKKDGTLSSAAFAEPKGLSVERGNYRDRGEVVQKYYYLKVKDTIWRKWLILNLWKNSRLL